MINPRYFIDSKEFLVAATSPESSYCHFSFYDDRNYVVSLEHIPENYPSTTVVIYPTLEAYIAETEWENITWIFSEYSRVNEKLMEMIKQHLKSKGIDPDGEE